MNLLLMLYIMLTGISVDSVRIYYIRQVTHNKSPDCAVIALLIDFDLMSELFEPNVWIVTGTFLQSLNCLSFGTLINC